MAQVELDGGSGNGAMPRVPLGRRLRAWWNGEILEVRAILEDVEAALSEQNAGGTPRFNGVDVPREDLVQQIWGPGLARPDGKEHFLKLLKPLGLTSEHTLLLVGCDMATTLCHAVSKLDCYVNGYESDPLYLSMGMKNVGSAGLSKRIELGAMNYEEFKFKPETTDHVFLRDILWDREDRAELLEKFTGMLRASGQLLITDNFLADGKSTKDLGKLPQRAPGHDRMITGAAFVELMTAAGLDVRINEDLSDSYIDIIAPRWAGFATKRRLKGLGPNSARHTLELAEHWIGRVLAMKKGRLQARRFLAIKPLKMS